MADEKLNAEATHAAVTIMGWTARMCAAMMLPPNNPATVQTIQLLMLLPYEQALLRILESTSPLARPPETVPLSSTWPWRTLSEPIIATGAHPRFDNSAVDGYAFHIADLEAVGVPRSVAFVVASGAVNPPELQPGQVARIFTGAIIPAGAAAVAMQEDVDAAADGVRLHAPLALEAGVRREGSDFAKGETLANSGSPITPGIAGLLASQGVTRPSVMALPSCVILTTGDEIIPPDHEPGPGQLRDSIGAILAHAAAPYAVPETAYAPDDPARIRRELARAVDRADAVFIAGGASVGDRDFTAGVVRELGHVEFHGINVRPGKPLLFGLVNGKAVIGLPGNPASAFVCFHLFGVPLLRRLGGWSDPRQMWLSVPFGGSHPAESRDVFARVTITDGFAAPVLEQASFGLRSLAAAHALARLPAGAPVAHGDAVQVTLL
ncbi:MAG: molybdopterin molybdotransferase MoeA [Fimbriimonadaceae bacterium]